MSETSARIRSVGLAAVLLGACGDAVDPSEIDLTGRWRGTPNSLGIASMTIELTEENSALSGTGTYTSNTSSLSDGTLELSGLHLAAELTINVDFVATSGTFSQNFNGHVEGEDSFILVFPSDPVERVSFHRQ